MSTKVADSTGYGPNRQMSVFGYIMAGVMVIILLPLLPVLIPAYVLWRVFVAEEPVERSFETWRRDSGRSRNGS
ncbi:hypothetical protein [Natronorubrum sp. A-ect3]|uniref:DUF7535 family protein n=1 Tax=Natronorubrum sp. A-ect3 TaxID=3242698 RepID=UPI00359E9AD6